MIRSTESMGDGIEPSLLPRIDKITLQRNIRNWTSGKLWNSIILPASCCFYLLGRHSFQQPGPGLPRSPPVPQVAKELYSVTDGHQTTHHVAAFCLVHMLVVREWWLISGWATFRWGDCIFNIWLIHLVLLIPFFAWKRIIWKESDLTMPRCNISFSTLHFI